MRTLRQVSIVLQARGIGQFTASTYSAETAGRSRRNPTGLLAWLLERTKQWGRYAAVVVMMVEDRETWEGEISKYHRNDVLFTV